MPSQEREGICLFISLSLFFFFFYGAEGGPGLVSHPKSEQQHLGTLTERVPRGWGGWCGPTAGDFRGVSLERCWSTSLGITTWEAELGSSPCSKPQRGHCPCAESISGMLLAWEEASGAWWWPQSSGTPRRRLPRGEAVPAGTFQAAATASGCSSFPKNRGEVLVFHPRGEVFLMHFPIIPMSSDFPRRPQMTRWGQAAPRGRYWRCRWWPRGSKSRGKYLGSQQGELPRWEKLG